MLFPVQILFTIKCSKEPLSAWTQDQKQKVFHGLKRDTLTVSSLPIFCSETLSLHFPTVDFEKHKCFNDLLFFQKTMKNKENTLIILIPLKDLKPALSM